MHRDFQIAGGRIAALEFSPQAEHKVIALHGWLDNAASFVPLAATLDAHLVALDLPGHGHSSHLPEGVRYHLVDLIDKVLACADQLHWSQFSIVGHSLGGCVAPLIAVSAPERIRSIAMIDALGPVSEAPDKLPERLQRAHASSTRSTRIYSSIEQAVSRRLSATPMSVEAARLIVERSLMECDGGYGWRYDPRLLLPSPSYLSESQVHSLLSALSCPCHVQLAESSFLIGHPLRDGRLACFSRLDSVYLPGQHHLHMDAPLSSASALQTFWDTVGTDSTFTR